MFYNTQAKHPQVVRDPRVLVLQLISAPNTLASTRSRFICPPWVCSAIN